MTSRSSEERPGGEEPILTLPGRFHAVVFDVDGLLLDTEPGWRRAEAELLRRHGAVYGRADEEASLGRPIHAVVDRYAERLGLHGDAHDRLFAELLELAGAEYDAPIPIRPGAIDLLAALRGRVPLGIASNTPGRLVTAALESTGLADCFDAGVSADDVARPKPAPDVYLEACRRLAVSPHDAVALEDSPTGVAAARAAGLAVIGVPESPGMELPGAARVVASLEDLLPLDPA